MHTPQPRTARVIDSFFSVMYPGEDHFRGSPEAMREVRALTAALVTAVVGTCVGLIVFRGETPIWGPVSPGSVGLVLVAAAATVASGLEYRRQPSPVAARWEPRAAAVQHWVSIGGISLAHGGIALLLAGLLNATLVRGFDGLVVDVFTSTVIVAFAGAGAAYAATLSAGDMTPSKLSTLLAVFMSGGVVVAMLTTSDAEWWKLHFSELGAGDGVSGIVFNVTVLVGGMLLATLGALLAPALTAWSEAAPPSSTRNAGLVSWAFALIGICLAGVGIVPVNVSLVAHNTFATGMAVVFGALLIGLRWLLDGFSRAFLLFSDVSLVAIGVSAVLFWPVSYYNLAAFELVAAGIIFVWLIIFLRHVDAVSAVLDDRAAIALPSPTPEQEPRP